MLYLIRHTEVCIEKNTCYGQLDIPLKKPLEKSFKKITVNLKKEGYNHRWKIISSPLKRCVTLAKFIDPNFSTHRALMEMNFGDWEGKKWTAIPLEKSKKWTDDILNEYPPNGENYQEFSKRIINFYEQTIRTEKTENIVLVTHAGVIRCLYAHLQNIDAPTSFNLKVPYGHMLKLS